MLRAFAGAMRLLKARSEDPRGREGDGTRHDTAGVVLRHEIEVALASANQDVHRDADLRASLRLALAEYDRETLLKNQRKRRMVLSNNGEILPGAERWLYH